MADINLKRIYEPAKETDGHRILVDRVWPRGIRKEDAKLTSWMKDLAPSSELRKWFCHKPELFNEFKHRYIEELRSDDRKIQMLAELTEMAQIEKVTLLYGAKDQIHNQAVVVCEELKRRLSENK